MWKWSQCEAEAEYICAPLWNGLGVVGSFPHHEKHHDNHPVGSELSRDHGLFGIRLTSLTKRWWLHDHVGRSSDAGVTFHPTKCHSWPKTFAFRNLIMIYFRNGNFLNYFYSINITKVVLLYLCTASFSQNHRNWREALECSIQPPC